jgi:PmbA protein
MDDNLLNDVVSAALKAGADAAEAVFAERQSLSVSVRLGELEEVEREEARDLGLRVFVGQRSATVSGSDISSDARAKLIERAVAMARLAPEDPYASLALETQARMTEDAARTYEGVTNTDGGSASWSSASWRLLTSDGFSGVHAATGHSLSCSAIAGEGASMERGGEGRSARHFADLPGAGDIGREAGRSAVARLNAQKIASTTAPVIFENRLAMSLIGPLLGAISGPSIARGSSFLKDKLHQQIFAKGVDLIEDPHRVRGLGSAPFDDEGVETVRRALIDNGVLTTWLLNTSSAKQLGLATTGHASRGLAGPSGVSTSNLTLSTGDRDLAGLMEDAKTGLLVTSMFGPSLNGNTGDWSVGCSGLWFENGEVTGPVTEITVAGNLIDIYARLIPGSDLEFRGSNNAPSILVDGLAIAGK